MYIDDPEDVAKATSQYIEENNVVGQWLEENYTITNDPSDKIGSVVIFERFGDDTKNRMMSQKLFTKAMKFKNCDVFKSGGKMFYKGLVRKVLICSGGISSDEDNIDLD